MSRLPRSVALSVLIGATCCGCLAHADSPTKNSDTLRFDMQWWMAANSDEQQGFIYGYGDCRQPGDKPLVSIVDEQAFVYKTLNSRNSGAPNGVVAAIHLAWKTMRSQVIPMNAEVLSGPHGFLDGEWWGGFTGSWPSGLADADRGYLEGYLACASSPVTVQSVSRYQTAINRYYASGHHDHDKIASVLKPLLKETAAHQN
jgi:hypothetical protein